MRLHRLIPFVLALILLPALAASIDADPSRPCGSNEVRDYRIMIYVFCGYPN
jgi:hypothetical protein